MRILIIGGGGHASDVMECLQALEKAWGKKNAVIGIVADGDVDPRRLKYWRLKLLGSLDDIGCIDATHYIICIGYSAPRKAVSEKLLGVKMMAIQAIHPTAIIAPEVPIGEGVVALANCRIGPLTQVGRHVLISYGSLVGHDCLLEDFVTVMPGAIVSGNVHLGECCLIGAGAVIIEGISIGAQAVIGAGAIVVKDVSPGSTVVGNPARVIN